MPNRVQNNPLRTRKDVIDAAVALLEPLPQYLENGSRLMLSATTAHYDEAVAGMEGFSRALWAIVPMLVGKVEEVRPYWEIWREGLIRGTDPNDDGYWGHIGHYDQRMVEMAVIGMGLCFAPERFWDELTPTQQQNLAAWLGEINLFDMPRNNWKFFRVLVNIGLQQVGHPSASQSMLDSDLDELETHYTRDGWYFDKPTQRDYYTLWAFHYYGLVYHLAMRDRDPERCGRFAERTRLMMPRFACWFDGAGRALPYGRSLTYRFAQSSFWSACAMAGIYTDEIGPGEVKGMWLRNLRDWFARPIFDRDGILTVGYGYPNLVVSEGYNAPGSPYWGLKTFAALALPEDDIFWTCEEKPYTPPAIFSDRECLQLLTRDSKNTQAISYTAGNHAYEHMHEDEKYEKFAYSTFFGFSVVKEAGTLAKGAFDSMLAFRRKEHDLWHARSGCESYAVEDDRVVFSWVPMEGIHVDSVILPLRDGWHIRKHTIRSEIVAEAAEAAFSVKRDGPGRRACDRVRSTLTMSDTLAAANGPFGTSAIYALAGYGSGTLIHTEPNTNMVNQRAELPTLLTDIHPGEHTLLCAVYASTDEQLPPEVPQDILNAAKAL